MSDDQEPYKPIACGLHSEYELAIMRRIKIRLSWVGPQGQRYIGKLMPLDLYTREGAEFLVAQALDGRQHDIRLDKITQSDVREAIAN